MQEETMTSNNKGSVTERKNNLPAEQVDYGQYAGQGAGDVGSNALMIPFMNLLQANSPQVVSDDPPGAKAGCFYNTATGEVVDGVKKGLVFLPCYEEEEYVEWLPRNKGGGGGAGFIASYPAKDEVVRKALEANRRDEKGKLLMPTGDNQLVQTFYVWGLFLEDDFVTSKGFGAMAFTSTKIKPYRAWYTARHSMKDAKQIPVFAHRARIKSFLTEKNGDKFWNVKIEPVLNDAENKPSWRASLVNPRTEQALLAEASAFRDMVVGGKAKLNHEAQAEETSSNIPF
jgi:hypothetical protein